MYEIPRYSIHRITILLAKYKSLNYFILEKTFLGIRFKIVCSIEASLSAVLNLAKESWFAVLHSVLSNRY